MSVQFTSPRFERVTVGPQASWGTVPNAGGTWTNTGAKLIRSGVNGCKLKAIRPLTPVPWKTGTRSTQPGIIGRSSASWSLSNLPVILSGTAGTVPDMDVILQSLFGQAPVTSGSCAYTFIDTAFVPFVLARFQHGLVNLTNQFAHGCLVEEATFTLNGNVFEGSFSGPASWVLDSENFAAGEDTVSKAGLTTFPVELVTPTTTGNIQVGFTGTATFDSNGMDVTSAPLISCSVRIRTGNMLVQDAFGYSYPMMAMGGERGVTVSCSFMDTDQTPLANLKQKAKSKSGINLTLVVGTAAGYIATFTIKNAQLNIPDYADDNARVTAGFGESPAHASAIASVDDLALTLA